MSEYKNRANASRRQSRSRIVPRYRGQLTTNMAILISALCAPSVAQTNRAPGAGNLDASPDSLLGRGYDTGLGRFTDVCVQGRSVLRGNRKGAISGIYNEASDQYLNSLTGTLSGKVDLLLIGGDARIDYVSRVARNALATSYTYRFAAELGTFVLDDRALTSVGSAASGASEAERRARCGDTFVDAVKVGAEFYVSVTFELANRDELERFVATVEVTALFGLVSASKTWASETQSFAHTGYVRIEPFQRGGNLAALQSVMDSGKSICRFDEVEPCQELLRNLSIYATTTGASGLRAQLRDPTSWAILELVSTQYRYAGLDVLGIAPVQVSRISEILRELVGELNRRMSLKDRAAFLLVLFENDSERQQHVRELMQRIADDIEVLNTALRICRATNAESECSAAYSAWKGQQYTVDESELSFGSNQVVE